MTARPSTQPVQATEQFQEYCRQLAIEYASQGQSRLLKWSPLGFVVIGTVLAFSLVYINLSWFFFGPAFAIAGVTGLVLTGAVDGKMLMRDRVWRWLRNWPLWEYLVLAVVLVVLIVAAIVYGFWGSVFMGSVVGIVTSTVLGLATLPSLVERRESLLEPFANLVAKIEGQNVNPLMLQAGLPGLLGPHWVPIFEAKFGYQAYRSVTQQLSQVQPELMQHRPKIRDTILDLLHQGANQNKGMIGTLALSRTTFYQSQEANKILGRNLGPLATSRSAAPSIEIVRRVPSELLVPETVAPRDMTPAPGNRSADSLHVAHIGNDVETDDEYRLQETPEIHAHLHADQINIGSMNTHTHTHTHSMGMSKEDMIQIAALAHSIDPPKVRGHRKAAYDTMLQEAWSDRTHRRKRFPTLQKWLGEEMRMGIGMLLAVAFVSYLIQAGAIDAKSRGELVAAFEQTNLWSFSGMNLCGRRVVEVFAAIPARLPWLGVSGWSIGILSVLWFLSGFFRDGWPYTLFVALTTVILLTLLTIAIDAANSNRMLAIAAVLSITIMTAGLLLDRKIPDWIAAYQKE